MEVWKLLFELGDAAHSEAALFGPLGRPGRLRLAVERDPKVGIPVDLSGAGFEEVSKFRTELLDGVVRQREAP
jgi:hypothetical protein